ncbi:MAG: carbohydrate binding domain-containing protein [Oscillospiraceae bacterium]|nr:carbohydrate binding domain-containing protein [Oscillospiraceae bacterium]
MKRTRLSLLLGLASSIALSAISFPTVVNAEGEEDTADVPVVDISGEPIYSDDFESDVINGWSSLGGVAEISLDTSDGHESSTSLKITGREVSWHGPSVLLDDYFENEEAYRITGWVKVDPKASEDMVINCTLRFSDSVNVDSYVGVSNIVAKPGEWTYFDGTVETPEDLSSTLLYFECQQDPNLEFSLDDIKIYGKAPEAAPENAADSSKKSGAEKYEFDFENGFEEWVSRGDTRLIRTDEKQNSGNYSMLSTNRTKCWNGPSVSIDGIARDVEYNYEASVLYTDKKADDTHTFLLECQYSYNGTENYSRIADAEVTKGEWTKLAGSFTVPEGARNVTLYVQTANLPEDAPAGSETLTDLVSFYVDDIKAVRSDIANTPEIINTIKTMDSTTLLLIIAGVIGLIILLVVIIRVIFAGSNSDDEESTASDKSEGINDVMNSLESENSGKKASEEKKEAPKPEDKKPNEKKAEKEPEKKAEKEDKKPEETVSLKKEEVTEKKPAEESKSENKPAENKKQNENQPASNGGNNNNNNGGKKKHKKSKNSKEESREKEVFGIETFSYDDPDAATAADDDSAHNPDSPFDGF